MAETRRRYRWTITVGEEELAAVAAGPAAVAAVERWGRRRKWFMGAFIEPQDNGAIVVEATIRGRDLWHVNKRQGLLAVALAAALRVGSDRFERPDITRLPPHTNRGRAAARRQQQAGEDVRGQ